MKPDNTIIIHSTRSSRQRGLSLIELMVSITIGLLILVSLSSMFINQSRARAELDKSNRMIDNGRYSLELLSESLQLAGFYGAFGPTGSSAARFNACNIPRILSATSNLNILLLHTEGFDAATPASQIAGLPCGFTYAANSSLSLKTGSDIIVIRRLETTSVTQAAAPNDGSIYMQVSSCQYDTTPYRISTDPATLTLGQRNITGVDNCIRVAGINTIAAPFADLRKLKTEMYFIASNNNPGDGIPTLKRLELTNNGAGAPTFSPTPLVEGIEYMQVEYGVDDPLLDTDGIGGAGLDGVPDSYTSCSACTLEQWSNVVSVKFHLIARNIDETKGHKDTTTYSLGTAGVAGAAGTVGPFNDSYKRHAFTQLVRLTNPSGRRELP